MRMRILMEALNHSQCRLLKPSDKKAQSLMVGQVMHVCDQNRPPFCQSGAKAVNTALQFAGWAAYRRISR